MKPRSWLTGLGMEISVMRDSETSNVLVPASAENTPNVSSPSALRGKLREALLHERWGGDSDRDSHAVHNYYYQCAICRGDADRLAAFAVHFLKTESPAVDADGAAVQRVRDLIATVQAQDVHRFSVDVTGKPRPPSIPVPDILAALDQPEGT